ncbi:MAG: alcohol dehydrogenase catalytic domain-containing protein [Prolixibacteraceae bacterium]
MKKSVLTGINKIELIEVPKPILVHPNDVLIRMSVVGVCGSDIHYYKTGRIGSQVVEYPFTVGHEGAGIVESVGIDVTMVKPGDKVAVEPSIACGHCDQCKAGRENTCRNNLFLGCPGQIEGNLVEYLIFPEKQCLKLAEHQSIDDGATSEPLAIGRYAVNQAALKSTDTIGILGFGPIGMSVLQMAVADGIQQIFVSEKFDARGEVALKNGAKWLTNPFKENVETRIESEVPELLDVVFECCGHQETMDNAIEILKPGGKLILIGIPEFDRWTFKADLARRKELTIIHTRRQNNCTHRTLDMLASGKVDGRAMITHRFPFSKVAEAFDMVANYKDGVMKAMIDFD